MYLRIRTKTQNNTIIFILEWTAIVDCTFLVYANSKKLTCKMGVKEGPKEPAPGQWQRILRTTHVGYTKTCYVRPLISTKLIVTTATYH